MTQNWGIWTSRDVVVDQKATSDIFELRKKTPQKQIYGNDRFLHIHLKMVISWQSLWHTRTSLSDGQIGQNQLNDNYGALGIMKIGP